MILLLVWIIGTTTGFEFKCPGHAEWRLRANIYCFSAADYVCLFHLLDKKYQDVCLTPDQSSIGSKLVFQPYFNIAKCRAARYQPIVFSTHGNSDCILQKSECSEEGQVIYSNGSFSNDTACRCDYTKRYAFVNKPKHSCYCIPSEEDCSCFRVMCTNLSPDYRCIPDGEVIKNTKCLEIHPQIFFRLYNMYKAYNVTSFIEDKSIGYFNAYLVSIVIITNVAVYIVFVLLAKCIFDKLSQHADLGKISLHVNGNKTSDEGKKQFIHELFMKGECGKFHFARIVFIGKNGVGKTSLMRRLLWQNKEDVTSTLSTDGIEVEKCNINIKDGTWSQCEQIDDDLTRLIHQVYTRKNINVEGAAAENVVDEGNFGSNIYESHKESSDKSNDTASFDEDNRSVSYESDDSSKIHIYPFTSQQTDNNIDIETPKTDLNQIQPKKINCQIEYKGKINSNETKSDHTNDYDISIMTSSIMKSALQLRERKHGDMLALCWLWNFAGQKDYYATHQVFLSKCAVYLLVTDSLNVTTDEETGINFEDSTEYVRFWFDAIHCYWSTTQSGRVDPPIIVVCTNEDRFKEPSERQKRQEQLKNNLRKVLKDQKKRRHLRNVYFVSNTEDDDNVFEEIRNDISCQIMDMKDWGTQYPLKWLLFQQVLEKLKESGVSISATTKLSKIAKHKDIGITNDEELKLCLQYCHDNGTVIYFKEENLQDYVILDPKWLVDAFRCLVSDKIENVITSSDHWQNLTETGEITDKLITELFKKEPKFKFLENKSYLIEVMKRFDIIVNLKNSTALYMPGMTKSCTFEEVRKQFMEDRQSFYRTSWLCLEFQFLPPAFFNHILAWYIKQYSVSVILGKGTRNERKALYRQIGVFDLDSSGCEQLVVCEGPNVIALQIWNSKISDKEYGNIRKTLYEFLNILSNRYRLKITFTTSFKCKDGDFTINRRKTKVLFSEEEYCCIEHKTNHLSDELVQPWYVNYEIRRMRLKESFRKYGRESDEDI